MNEFLKLTGLTLDDMGSEELGINPMIDNIESLNMRFVAVMIAAKFDRNSMGDFNESEQWMAETYGAPPSGPFTERTSAVLRDNKVDDDGPYTGV